MRNPMKKDIVQPVLDALELLGGSATNPYIEKKIVEIMDLPEEVVNATFSNGKRRQLPFRIGYVKTELKKAGLIINVGRGHWALINRKRSGLHMGQV